MESEMHDIKIEFADNWDTPEAMTLQREQNVRRRDGDTYQRLFDRLSDGDEVQDIIEAWEMTKFINLRAMQHDDKKHWLVNKKSGPYTFSYESFGRSLKAGVLAVNLPLSMILAIFDAFKDDRTMPDSLPFAIITMFAALVSAGSPSLISPLIVPLERFIRSKLGREKARKRTAVPRADMPAIAAEYLRRVVSSKDPQIQEIKKSIEGSAIHKSESHEKKVIQYGAAQATLSTTNFILAIISIAEVVEQAEIIDKRVALAVKLIGFIAGLTIGYAIGEVRGYAKEKKRENEKESDNRRDTVIDFSSSSSSSSSSEETNVGEAGSSSYQNMGGGYNIGNN